MSGRGPNKSMGIPIADKKIGPTVQGTASGLPIKKDLLGIGQKQNPQNQKVAAKKKKQTASGITSLF